MYDAPIEQAWLRLWVDLCPDSQLKGYLHDDEPAAPLAVKHQKLVKMPVSDWAKRVVGDDRLSQLTLQDILDGVEDYFEIFDQMKRKHPQAYVYFSRVGVPIATKNLAIWKEDAEATTVALPASLPSYFGVFMAENKTDYREKLLENKSTLLDFHLFEKPKNHAAGAPPGTTVFVHNAFMLSRNAALTKAEAEQFKWIEQFTGMGWYVGVLPDGHVRALPYRRTKYQTLPNGGHISHSRFEIHPRLFNLAQKTGGPHEFVRIWFNLAVAFAAASVSGITVTIAKGRRRCRVGVPIAALKDFFADRDPAAPGERRKPVMHFRHAHDRHMRDGRIIAVGEHLSGERFFTWRGYDVAVGAPGIHYASPEGFNLDMYSAGNRDAPLPPEIDLKRMTPVTTVAAVLARQMQRPLKVPIRYGEPTRGFNGSTLPQPDAVKTEPPPSLLIK